MTPARDADVEAIFLSVAEHAERPHDRPRHVDLFGENVACTSAKHAHRGLRSYETVDHLIDGAVAAAGEDNLRPRLRRLARECHRVQWRLGRPDVDLPVIATDRSGGPCQTIG